MSILVGSGSEVEPLGISQGEGHLEEEPNLTPIFL